MKLVLTNAELQKAVQFYLNSVYIGEAPKVTDVSYSSSDYTFTVATEQSPNQIRFEKENQ